MFYKQVFGVSGGVLLLTIIAILINLVIGIQSVNAENQVVTVGVYENAPKIFIDESLKPAGIFVDIIEEIAEHEGWELQYVPGTWAEGLDRLEKGELDLMPDVAYTTERDSLFDFHKKPVLSSWFQVYALKGSGIQSILDLNGKRITVLERSVQQDAFEQLADSFGLDISLIPLPDYNATFELVAGGGADAAVSNRFYGLRHLKQFGLEDTAVIFNPSNLFFAVPEGTRGILLKAIDDHIARLKADPRSVYYRSMKRWISEPVHFMLPGWVKIIGILAGSALFFSLVGSVLLKRQVNARTRVLLKQNKKMVDVNQALRDSEHKYRELLEHANSIILHWTSDGDITFLNEFGQRYFGFTETEIVGQHVVGTIVPETETGGRDLRPLMEKICADPVAFEQNVNENIRRNGERVWIAWTNKVYFDDNGQVRGILSIGTDITDRRLSEKKLRESEEKYKSILNNIEDGYYEVDLAGNLTFFNPSLCRIIGYSNSELMGMNNKTYMDKENAGKVFKTFNQVYATGKPSRALDWEIIRKDGTKCYINNAVSLIKDIEGNAIGFRGVARDVTERRKAEEQIRLLNDDLRRHAEDLEKRVAERTEECQMALEQAESADRLKSAFLATMSHELRTPLNSIIGFTGILIQGLAGPLNEEQYKQMCMVQTSSRHLLALINDVLDISKIESGQLSLDVDAFELRPSIEKTVQLVSPLAENKGINLELEIAEDVAAVETDQRRLEQVILNLLNNAVKFTEEGQIRIACQTDNDHYRLSVSDTGIGIQPEEISGLFQPFHQIDTGLARKHEGTGLGLSISRKLIEMMGGTIDVQSQWGRGSVFTICFPKQSGGVP